MFKTTYLLYKMLASDKEIPDKYKDIDETINGIWEHLRGDMAVIEADFEELVDWVIHYVDSSLDEKM